MISEAQLDWVRAYARGRPDGLSALESGLIREMCWALENYDDAVRYANVYPHLEAALSVAELSRRSAATLARCFSKLPGFPVD